jgi:hypothetical protein
MDRKTVLTKTAKGLMELTGKTSLLARDVRGVLSKVDGKATVGDLQARLDCSERKLNEHVAKLMRGGFVREFVVAPASISPPSQMGLTGHTLDFTAFVPAAGERAREAERQSAEADEVAREVAAAQRRRGAEKIRHELEAKAKREAEEKARREVEARRDAEQKTEHEAQEKARREAQAKAKREAEEEARLEAEAKAKREAEEKARREAKAKALRIADEIAKRDAEEKTRRAAEAKAKREAEEKSRREAEAKARRQAEQQAQREAEAKAKLEAQQQAQREAEAKAKREAEEKARLEAEAKKADREAEQKARLELLAKQKREIEENKRRDAQAKAQRQADAKAKRAADEASRREAKAKAKHEAEEKKRRQAEAKALHIAEEKLRHEAEVKAKYAEEKSRLAAEREAVRATQEGARQAQEEIRAEVEARTQAEQDAARRKMREEERARAKAEAEIAARARKDGWIRETAESGAQAAALARDHQRETVAMAGRLARRRGGGPHWGRRLSLLLFLLLFAAAVALPFWPLNTQRYEVMAGAALGQPVSIGAASIRYLPKPHLELRDMRIGDAATIEQARMQPDWSVLWGEMHGLRALKLSGIELRAQAIAAALWRPTQGAIDLPADISLERLRIVGAAIDIPEVSGVAHAGPHGIKSIVLADRETGSELRVRPAVGRAQFELHTHSAQQLLALPLPLTDTVLRGEANAQGLNIHEFEGRAYDGLIKGSARLSWDEQWTLEGDMRAAQLDVSRIAPALSGRIGGNARFAMQAGAYQALFVQPKMVGEFNLEQGSLRGLDLVRSMQESVQGGATQFNALRGKFSFYKSRLALRGVRLEAGLLNANGSADLEAGELSGRLNIEVKMPAGVQRASLNVEGTPEHLTIK